MLTTNSIIENNYKSLQPIIGMGATYLGFSDRHPYTVISISKSGKTIQVQEDTAKRMDENGMSESQKYEYTPNPNGQILTCRLSKKDGHYHVSGYDYRAVMMLGKREEYYDYSF